MFRLTVLFSAAVCFALACATFAADWPQFRGPSANGIAPDTGINKNWAARPPKELWRTSLGDGGYCGPSVAQGRVLILDHAADQDVVRAIRLDNGQDIWRFAYQEDDQGNYGHARSTPTFANGSVYTYSRLGVLNCLNAETGKIVWTRDVFSDFHGQRPNWDLACSPLVDDGKVIVTVGGQTGLVALNAQTGETVWAGGNSDPVGYNTPVVATIGGTKQYVLLSAKNLYGVDSATGKVLWSAPWAEPQCGVNAASPLVDGNYVFVATGYGVGCGLFQIAPPNATVLWRNQEIVAQFNTPIYYHGYLFGIGDPGNLVCLRPQNGAAAWRQPGFEKGGVVGVDDVLIAAVGNTGEVVMCNATADAYQELGRIKPLGGQTWTAPIIADGKLLVRNKKALVCLDLM